MRGLALVLIPFLSSALAYEICSTSGIVHIYCQDGYYCCGSSTCCQNSSSKGVVIGGCLGSFALVAAICCICRCLRRRQPGTIVMHGQPHTNMACVTSSATHEMPGQQSPYGQQPAYEQQPMFEKQMAYEHPAIVHQMAPQNQQNFAQPPPPYS